MESRLPKPRPKAVQDAGQFLESTSLYLPMTACQLAQAVPVLNFIFFLQLQLHLSVGVAARLLNHHP